MRVQRGHYQKDLLYADDLAIVAESEEELQERVVQWQENLENKSLKSKQQQDRSDGIKEGKLERKAKIKDRNNVAQVEFCYLGKVIVEKEECNKDVRARIGKAWQKWREVTGVVCDKWTPLKMKVKIYKSMTKPLLLHGTESAAQRREEERKLEVTEMRMLRNICWISLKEHRRNDDISRKDIWTGRNQ